MFGIFLWCLFFDRRNVIRIMKVGFINFEGCIENLVR